LILLFKFLLTGGIATAIQYIILGIGTSYYNLSASFSTGIGYGIGSVISYFMNYFFTFKSTVSHSKATFRFYAMVCVGWFLSVVLMYLLVDVLNLNKWFSQIFTTGIVFIFNYLISKSLIFR
jgi:putative flippase GtrA